MSDASSPRSNGRRTYIAIFVVALGAAACAPRVATSPVSALAPTTIETSVREAEHRSARRELRCDDCEVSPPSPEIARALERRLADLEARGGVCSQYGAVLERSYRSGRITIRPYMWRVGTHLASGEAKPNGEMTLAREIDELNVGLRTVDDVIRSMEHEAVHITFDLRAGLEGGESDADRYVRVCSAESRRTS